jgi:hypothetical protein
MDKARIITWVKRIAVSIATVISLTTLALILILFLEYSDPISNYNCRRIEIGMEKSQVEGIIGRPPGDYATDPLLNVSEVITPKWAVWKGNNGTIYVRYDESGKVAEKSFADFLKFRGMPPRLLDQLDVLFFE